MSNIHLYNDMLSLVHESFTLTHNTYLLPRYLHRHKVDTIFGYFETSERIVDSCYLSQSEGGVKYQKHSSTK